MLERPVGVRRPEPLVGVEALDPALGELLLPRAPSSPGWRPSSACGCRRRSTSPRPFRTWFLLRPRTLPSGLGGGAGAGGLNLRQARRAGRAYPGPNARDAGGPAMPTAMPTGVPPELADGPAVAGTRERFLSGDPVEPAPPTGVRGPILASWRRSRTGRSPRTGAAALRPRPRRRHPAHPRRRAGAALAARAARRPVGQHPAHRRRRAGAGPADRGRGARAAPGPGPAGARLQLRRAVRRHRTGSAPRWRAAGRCTSSATSTTPSTWRTWPAPRCRSRTRCPARRSA